jgi:hypothetical protein
MTRDAETIASIGASTDGSVRPEIGWRSGGSTACDAGDTAK